MGDVPLRSSISSVPIGILIDVSLALGRHIAIAESVLGLRTCGAKVC